MTFFYQVPYPHTSPRSCSFPHEHAEQKRRRLSRLAEFATQNPCNLQVTTPMGRSLWQLHFLTRVETCYPNAHGGSARTRPLSMHLSSKNISRACQECKFSTNFLKTLWPRTYYIAAVTEQHLNEGVRTQYFSHQHRLTCVGVVLEMRE